MFDCVALPRFRAWRTRQRRRPETPSLGPCRLVVCDDETTCALIPARDSGNDQFTDGHWGRGRGVIQTPVRHLFFPDQRSRETVQREKMTVVGRHEYAISPDGCAAVDSS